MMIKTLFVSYSHEDSKLVNRISNRLTKLGFQVLQDIRDLQGGDLWREKLTKAIHGCHFFLFIVSRNSINSDNVRRELDICSDAKRKIIPLRLEAVDIPINMQYQLAGVQWIDIHGKNRQEGFERLLVALQDVSETKSSLNKPEINTKKPLLSAEYYEDFIEIQLPININNFDSTKEL